MNLLPKNMTHMGGGYYIVRTQAGFRKALKSFGWKDDPKWPSFTEADAYPKKYPAMVHLSSAYRGYHYIHVDCLYLGVDMPIRIHRLMKKLKLALTRARGEV